MCFSSTASDAARAFVLLCFGTATCDKNALAALQILFPSNLTDPAVVDRVEKIVVSSAIQNVCYKDLLTRVNWTCFSCILLCDKGDPCNALPG